MVDVVCEAFHNVISNWLVGLLNNLIYVRRVKMEMTRKKRRRATIKGRGGKTEEM